MFHWVEDKPRALDEIYRVLRPGGRLGMNCHDPGHSHEVRLLVWCAMIAAHIELAPELGYPSLGVSEAELIEQIRAAGFVQGASEQRTSVDAFPNIEAIIGWASSSMFGNFLNGISNAERGRLIETLGRLLEVKRSPDGIRLERYLTFGQPVSHLSLLNERDLGHVTVLHSCDLTRASRSHTINRSRRKLLQLSAAALLLSAASFIS